MDKELFKYSKKEKIFNQDLKNQNCHASTIVKMSDGNLMAAWFQGSKEGNPDVCIYGSRRIDGAWTAPVLLADAEGIPCWNPVLFEKEENCLILFYKCGKEIASWKTMCKISQDYGQSWSEAFEMIPGDIGGRGPVRNKCIRLKSGRILAPASLENGPWRCFADISDDEGKTWRKSREVLVSLTDSHNVNANFREIPVSEQSYTGRGIIQPSFWEETDKVHMVMRSSEGWIFHSESEDEGETWSEAQPLSIPNNNSGIDVVKGSDRKIYLVCNPIGESWGKRSPICIFVSDGEKWTEILKLDYGEGEFSYPCIICDNDTLYISYTWKRVNIAFWEIKLNVDL